MRIDKWTQNPEYKRILNRKADKTLVLNPLKSGEKITVEGMGSFSEVSFDGVDCIKTVHSVLQEISVLQWYGSVKFSIDLGGIDLSDFTRISLDVYPIFKNSPFVWTVLGIVNGGENARPRVKYNECNHKFNAVTNEWNKIIWEIPEIKRDKVEKIFVEFYQQGKYADNDNEATVYLSNLTADNAETEPFSGWNLDDRIAVSFLGYKPNDTKTALTQNKTDNTFSVVSLDGKTVFENPVTPITTQNGEFLKLDFSGFKNSGSYMIKYGDKFSSCFKISDTVYNETFEKGINFFKAQRCGEEVEGIHPPCHLDSYVRHPDGRTLPACGGWHDAGDVSQGTVNTAEIVMNMADVFHNCADSVLKEQYKQELQVGVDWLKNTRFNDGYRIFFFVQCHKTENKLGDFDDIVMDASNDSFVNLVTANAFLKAYSVLKNEELLKLAIEDFRFGFDLREEYIHRNLKSGINKNTIHFPVIYYSAACFTAVELYLQTKDEQYKLIAKNCAEYILKCQETDFEILKGAFYTDYQKQVILHFSHLSFEHYIIDAIKAYYKISNANDYLDALKLYAEYIKNTAFITEPYGIISGGVYNVNNFNLERFRQECVDEVTADFKTSIKNGYKLSDEYYLRRMSISNFVRGHFDLLLSKAIAILEINKICPDERLYNIAKNSVDWTIGRNPFAKSYMYGVGDDYHVLYNEFSNQIHGAMPVGFMSFENEDIPFMPFANNSTYNEVWVRPVADILRAINLL